MFLNKSFQALIGSILLHVAIILAIALSPEPKTSAGPITIEILDNDQAATKRKRWIVEETAQKPSEEEELLEKLKTQSQLLSKYAKRVQKQQFRRGDSKSDGVRGPKKKLDLQPRPKRQAKTVRGFSVRKRAQKEILNNQDLRSNLDKTIAIGGGRSGVDQIPGVEEGYFTSLNTDQFKYYSFFSRVGQAIRYRWVSGVRNFLSRASSSTIYQLAADPKPTLLEILLDKEGMVVQVNILKSSGNAVMDEAAVQAFIQASPLNHPPDGLIDPRDRMVRLRFSFFVRLNPQYLVNGR